MAVSFRTVNKGQVGRIVQLGQDRTVGQDGRTGQKDSTADG